MAVAVLTATVCSAADPSASRIPVALDAAFRPLPDGATSAEVMVRARVVDSKPVAFARLVFGRHDRPFEFTQYAPVATVGPGPGVGDGMDREEIIELGDDQPAAGRAFIEEPGQVFTHLWLNRGVWSPAIPVSRLGAFPIIQVRGMLPQAVRHRKDQMREQNVPVAITNVTVEFEVSFRGQVLKTFAESATEGNTVIARFAVHRLDAGRDQPPLPPGAEFVEETYGLTEYAQRRADRLEALPWAGGRLPERYVFMTCCESRAIASQEVHRHEYRAVRQLGVNGLFYGFRAEVDEAVRNRTGVAAAFGRARGDNQNLPGAQSQYLLPEFGRGGEARPGDGCPYHPVNAGLAEKTRAGVQQIMERIRQTPYEEYWFQTISEIGSVFDRAPERKAHMGACPYCREAFRDYVRGFGQTLADFGTERWDDIRPTFGYFAQPSGALKPAEDAAGSALAREAEAARNASVGPGPTVEDDDPGAHVMGEMPGDDRDADDADAAPAAAAIPLPDYGLARLRYYSARFNNESSARVFAPLRQALVEQNDAKRRALAAGRTDTTEARQPWVYSFALRGNTFLMGGHSLDFFDWYRQADNAFMYETSNRDPRVWGWDSYLCDVGRIHQEKLGTAFGLMVKPDRGAVVQRTLTAVARQVRAIYWYTYGPDYVHPDTFAKFYKFPLLEAMSRTVHMIGEAEQTIYDAVWAYPAAVAVVRPQTSAILDGSHAAWENGKWVYQALTHAHLPVDALDEGYLLSEDLSRYRAIYISGAGLRRDVSEKLAGWVEAGGVLYTGAGGLVHDEAGLPLAALQPLLGLSRRTPVEVWGGVRRYGATALAGITRERDAPAGARVGGQAPFGGSFDLAVGREVLEPGPDAEVLATYADGGVAAIRRAAGKGWVYVVGFYAGLEYAADVLRPDYDMSRDFRDDKRAFVAAPALAAGVEPVVEASHPLIEGVLLKDAASGGRAVVLMNWAYQAREEGRGRDLVPAEPVTLLVRDAGPVGKVRSLWLREPIPHHREGARLVVTLPRIEDGDILLLE